jgi:hypothetical protein
MTVKQTDCFPEKSGQAVPRNDSAFVIASDSVAISKLQGTGFYIKAETKGCEFGNFYDC